MIEWVATFVRSGPRTGQMPFFIHQRMVLITILISGW